MFYNSSKISNNKTNFYFFKLSKIITHFEAVQLQYPVLDVVHHLPDDGQHGNVGLARAGGGADEHVLVAMESGGEDF